jgi:hypothetical protein
VPLVAGGCEEESALRVAREIQIEQAIGIRRDEDFFELAGVEHLEESRARQVGRRSIGRLDGEQEREAGIAIDRIERALGEMGRARSRAPPTSERCVVIVSAVARSTIVPITAVASAGWRCIQRRNRRSVLAGRAWMGSYSRMRRRSSASSSAVG